MPLFVGVSKKSGPQQNICPRSKKLNQNRKRKNHYSQPPAKSPDSSTNQAKKPFHEVSVPLTNSAHLHHGWFLWIRWHQDIIAWHRRMGNGWKGMILWLVKDESNTDMNPKWFWSFGLEQFMFFGWFWHLKPFARNVLEAFVDIRNVKPEATLKSSTVQRWDT